MRNWEPEPYERQNLWLFIEAAVVGTLVLGIYGFALFEIVPMFFNWVHSLTF